MVEADKPYFTEILQAFAAIHKERLSPEMRTGYWMALQDMSRSEFERVSKHLMKHHRWFPKPEVFWTAAKSVGWT